MGPQFVDVDLSKLRLSTRMVHLHVGEALCFRNIAADGCSRSTSCTNVCMEVAFWGRGEDAEQAMAGGRADMRGSTPVWSMDQLPTCGESEPWTPNEPGGSQGEPLGHDVLNLC